MGAWAVYDPDGECPPAPPAFPSGSPATSMAGPFLESTTMRGHQPQASLHANVARRRPQRRGSRDAYFSRCGAASWRGGLLAMIVPAPAVRLHKQPSCQRCHCGDHHQPRPLRRDLAAADAAPRPPEPSLAAAAGRHPVGDHLQPRLHSRDQTGANLLPAVL
jgi:hypothetical protein